MLCRLGRCLDESGAFRLKKSFMFMWPSLMKAVSGKPVCKFAPSRLESISGIIRSYKCGTYVMR